MKPTLRQLEYLIAIADTGTFSEAAKTCYVSQPSLSAQIKDMEFHLGTSVFERGRQGAILTPIGARLLTQARLILRNVEELKVMAIESEGEIAGRVKLGVLPTIGPYLLPAATHGLHKTYPQLRMIVSEQSTMDLQKQLSDGQLDLIISTPKDHPEMQRMNLVKEDIFICVAADDPLAGSNAPIALSKLAGRELLTLGYGHSFANLVIRLAEKAGASASGSYTGTSLDAIRQMAAMGTGVAVLPSLYALSEARRDPQLIIRRINDKDAQREIALLWRAASPLGAKFEAIGAQLKAVAEGIMTRA